MNVRKRLFADLGARRDAMLEEEEKKGGSRDLVLLESNRIDKTEKIRENELLPCLKREVEKPEGVVPIMQISSCCRRLKMYHRILRFKIGYYAIQRERFSKLCFFQAFLLLLNIILTLFLFLLTDDMLSQIVIQLVGLLFCLLEFLIRVLIFYKLTKKPKQKRQPLNRSSQQNIQPSNHSSQQNIQPSNHSSFQNIQPSNHSSFQNIQPSNHSSQQINQPPTLSSHIKFILFLTSLLSYFAFITTSSIFLTSLLQHLNLLSYFIILFLAASFIIHKISFLFVYFTYISHISFPIIFVSLILYSFLFGVFDLIREFIFEDPEEEIYPTCKIGDITKFTSDKHDRRCRKCGESLKRIAVQTKCGHLFHKRCLREAFKESFRCPWKDCHKPIF
jgi:hypothetical protein